MIQYIQSRGRARHSNSIVWLSLYDSECLANGTLQYAHMVERGNLIHASCIQEAQRAEVRYMSAGFKRALWTKIS